MQLQDKGVNSCNGADQLIVHAPSALTEEWGLAKCEECFNCTYIWLFCFTRAVKMKYMENHLKQFQLQSEFIYQKTSNL